MDPEITVEVEPEPHPHADLIARVAALPSAPDRDAVLANLNANNYARMSDAELDVQDVEDRAVRRKQAEEAQ